MERKRRRGSRGGQGKNTNKQKSILQEVIDLLCAEGFTVTPPSDKKFLIQPKVSHSKSKVSENEKVPKLEENRKPLKTELNVFDWREVYTHGCEMEEKKGRDSSSTTDPNKNSKSKDKSGTNNAKNQKKENIPPCAKAVKIKSKNSKENNIAEWEEKVSIKLKKKNNKKDRKEKLIKTEAKAREKETAKESKQGIQKDFKWKKDLTFPKCIPKKDILQMLADQDPDDPEYVKGHIRINLKNPCEAYITMDGDSDILILSIRNRNRAFDGDLVAAMINPEEEWSTREDGTIQKTGTVVCILERIHLRKVVGTLVMHMEGPRLKCRDPRVPTLMIYPKTVPKKIKECPHLYANTLFLATIDRWITPFDCRGTIEGIIGDVGDLEGETKAILLANGLDVSPYNKKLTKGLPSSDYEPSAEDLEEREDWRESCVFTIDPATAVDLDDAVSCKKLSNGNYEVGVHISDVTHYMKASSRLDEEVSLRATTVYLVNTVYHMLPKSLCQLCSLSPGREKLSFSVVWEMTPEAEVINHRFTKSVIKSCYQMSYQEAQSIIDEPSKEWTENDLPNIQGKFSANDICECVNNLYKLSTQMRERRFADGALSINQPKLQIILDKETGNPQSYCIEERLESNKLIEEFMLLANMTVAKHLYEYTSNTAFLRIHGEPLNRVLARTAEDLGYLGVHLNIESAASLQSSLSLYEKTGMEGFEQKFATNCRMMVINALCAQSMPRAMYTCSGTITEKDGLRHYALNVPFYTHFTSPIRRYADCVVHRLLFASLNLSQPTNWSSELCAKIAANCNKKKYSAKIAQEKSNELYFIDLLRQKGPMETMAIVMKVKKRNMDVILCHIGITIRLRHSDLNKKADIEYNQEHSVPTIVVKWKKPEIVQIINVFSIINIRIEKHPKDYSIRGVLLPSRLNNDSDST